DRIRQRDVMDAAGDVQADAVSRADAGASEVDAADGVVQLPISQTRVEVRTEHRWLVGTGPRRFRKSVIEVVTIHMHAAALTTASPIAQQDPTTRADACAQRSAARHFPAANRFEIPRTRSERSGI